MEHTARLAVIEQNAKTPSSFERALGVLVELIDNILEDPSDEKYRKLKIDGVSVLETTVKVEGMVDFLKHIGFELEDGYLIFPKHNHLDNLQMAKCSMERKLFFLNGQPRKNTGARRKLGVTRSSRCQLARATVLTTKNSFLNSIESVFNDVLKYEDESLQEEARKCIPKETLEIQTREREKILNQGSSDKKVTFEICLLAELLAWFKESFFKWVDKPGCTTCGGQTTFRDRTMQLEGRYAKEMCRVEWFDCVSCGNTECFVRYNHPRELLVERRGRCGEWANCFALLCRALGFDTRYVLDTTDHVWCEVYDEHNKRWLHCDPCENALDTPLMYEHGWNKKLEYVIAYSRDDVQDVTWRYSSHHRALLSRRNRCSEHELSSSIMALRASRQQQVSESRREALTMRTLAELAELMVERKPTDYESQGRISGSLAWRQQRGEHGSHSQHTWKLTAGSHLIEYSPVADKYVGEQSIVGWKAGTWECENIARKVEEDWKMVYLARIAGEAPGTISWKFEAFGELKIRSLSLQLVSKLYETGRIQWTATYDDTEPAVLEFETKDNQNRLQTSVLCKSLVLTVKLSGGEGGVAWQHAQLFRQTLHSREPAFQVHLTVVNDC